MLNVTKKILRRLNFYANNAGTPYIIRRLSKSTFVSIVKLFLNRQIVTKYDNDIAISLNPAHGYGQLTYFLYELSAEIDTKRFIRQFLKEGMVVLDIGANVGVYSLLFRKLVGDKGKVVCFEPFAPTFNQLKGNFRLNDYSYDLLFNLAVSDQTADRHIYIDKNNDGENSLILSNNTTDGGIIHSVDLDSFWHEEACLNKINNIDLIKIDVEGWESQAIDGMYDILNRFKPVIIMEFNGYKFKSHSLMSYSKLVSIGYKCYLFERGELSEISDAKLSEYYEKCLDLIYIMK